MFARLGLPALSRWPLAGHMQRAQDTHLIASKVIYQNVIAMDHQFAGASNTAGPAHARLI